MSTWLDGVAHERAGAPGDRVGLSVAGWPGHVSPGAAPAPEELFARAMRAGRVHDALAVLNERVRYRFTGLYHADPPVLRNVQLYDRENPSLDVGGGAVPLCETYCGITTASASPFTTPDAAGDPRLLEHPARGSVLSYLGVPVRDASGRVWGTLCHFDFRPRLTPAGEAALLERCARSIAAYIDRLPRTDGAS